MKPSYKAFLIVFISAFICFTALWFMGNWTFEDNGSAAEVSRAGRMWIAGGMSLGFGLFIGGVWFVSNRLRRPPLR